MNLYTYVAESNPLVAKGILDSFGYEHANTPDMGLSQLVANVGEPALVKVMENHPDKEIILELFQTNKPCSCKSCSQETKEQFFNANGQEDKSQNFGQNVLISQTNVLLGVAFMFFAYALIKK